MKAPYVLRMLDEKRELDIKIDVLAGWIANSEHFNSLDPEEKQDQRNQLHHMRGYAFVLGSRLRRAGEDAPA